MRLGSIPVGVKKEKYYVVEDQYTATRYKKYKSALSHFNENVKIDKAMKLDFKRGN